MDDAVRHHRHLLDSVIPEKAAQDPYEAIPNIGKIPIRQQ